MRKMIFIALVATIGLSAGVHSKGVASNGEKYTIWTEDGGAYGIIVKNSRMKISGSVKDWEVVLKKQLNIAAKETKKMGYSYFVVTNSNVNNLNGFPLNNVKNLLKFITLEKRKPSFATDGSGRKPSNLISSTAMNLRFKPVPSTMLKNGLISVWSVKQTLRDTK